MRAIRTTTLRSTLAGASLLALAAASPVLAAEPADTAVQELVVTAQKREQRLIDVPLALTAYSGETLNELGLQEFEELGQFVPGFDVQNQSPNNPGFVMRGITSDSGEATTEPRVSVYQDGVSISKSRGSYVELFDLERVEIAKGPQSTLYGRGALIGAVNVIQAKAKPQFASNLRLEAGDYGYRMAEMMVNMPVNDVLAVRLSARSKMRDGYVENLLGAEDFNSTNTVAARLAIAYAPNERFKLDVLYNYQQDNPSGTSFKSLTYAPTNPFTGAVIGDRGRNSGAALSTVEGFENGQELGLNRRLWSLTSLASYEINDSLTLNSTSAYRYFTGEEVFDPDGFSLPLFVFAEDAQGKSASQEFRLNYDADGRVTAFGGVSWFWEDGSQRVPLLINEKVAYLFLTGALPIPNGLSMNAINAIPALSVFPSSRIEEYTNYGKTNSYDAFGDVTFKATDRLELTAGLRYTYDDKTSGYGATMSGPSIVGGSSATAGARGLIVQPTLNGRAQYKDFTDSGVTYRLVARYAASDDLSYYGSISTGRRPKVVAGSNGTPGAAATFRELPAEEVTSYEIGAKTALLDRRVTLEGAIYRYDYENFQTSQRNSSGQVVATNAGEAKSTGFEGQANFQATPDFLVFATYGYSHARFGNGLFEGNSFRLSPDHQASIGVKASVATAAGRFTFLPTYTWQSKMFFDNNNDIAALQSTTGVIKDTVQDEVQKGYGLLNLRLTYQPNDSDLTFGAFVTNVLEQDYIKDAGNTGDAFGIPTFIAGEPRFFGVSMTIKR